MQSREEIIRDINRKFDYKKSETEKRLFNLTLNFSLNDWNLVRTPEYFANTRSMDSKTRNSYLLKLVEDYLHKKRK